MIWKPFFFSCSDSEVVDENASGSEIVSAQRHDQAADFRWVFETNWIANFQTENDFFSCSNIEVVVENASGLGNVSSQRHDEAADLKWVSSNKFELLIDKLKMIFFRAVTLMALMKMRLA